MTSDNLVLAESERDIHDGDGARVPRRFFDFVVNDEPLAFKVRSAAYDLISCLWLDNATAASGAVKAAQRLLGLAEGDAPHGRVTVYGCAECGDLGCGGITVRLCVTEDSVVWAEWGYQNSYEDDIYDVRDIPGLRDFAFDRNDYERELAGAIERIRGSR